jgi:glutathione S-transferase
MGSTPEEKALARMWARRVDLGICEPLANGFRFSEGLELFKTRMLVRPEAADGLKAMAQDKLTWLNGQLEGKSFIGGDRIGLADILLFCFLAFGANVGQPLNPDNTNITAWYERMQARPSAQA